MVFINNYSHFAFQGRIRNKNLKVKLHLKAFKKKKKKVLVEAPLCLQMFKIFFIVKNIWISMQWKDKMNT